MRDAEAAALIETVRVLGERVRRLERRLDSLEPETTPGFPGQAPAPAAAEQRRSSGGESRVLDALGDALDAFGFGSDRA